MNKNQTYLRATFASRRRELAGFIQVKGELSGANVRVVPLGGAKSDRVQIVVEAIFQAGAKVGRLSSDEWKCLLEASTGTEPVVHRVRPAGQSARPVGRLVRDDRWMLLVKLAIRPQAGWGKLRDQFVALPDGTPFSLRLLLLKPQGKRRDSNSAGARTGNQVTAFTELPDVAKVIALMEALEEEAKQGPVQADKALAASLQQRLDLGSCLDTIPGRDVRQLRERLHKYGGENLFPNSIDRRRRRQPTQGTTAGKNKRGRRG